MGAKYRADHVGSLLRPQELLDARAAGLAAEPLRELEDRLILEALRRQQEAGLPIFTDGEFRRRTFMSDFNDSVDGLDEGEALPRDWSGAASAPAAVSRVSGVAVAKITQKRRMTAHEVAFMRQHCPGPIKVTLPSANQFPAIAYKRGVSEPAYASHSDLLWDVVPIIRGEIAALAGEGVSYIQIDAPRYSYYIDPKWRDYVRTEMGQDPDEALDEAIRADNACLEGLARGGVTLAIHLCRGNNRSQWYAEGGYDAIAESLFGRLNVDAFLLEYDSERAGTFAPLRYVPKGKTVVLGLVSTKTPQMERRADLIARIREAADVVPLEDLALSPQCGFASTMEGNLLSEDDQWRKLALVVETARAVWGSV
jgi:5-methyltetrahydropteroyltriglutamate--homocysteine methyltransferase